MNVKKVWITPDADNLVAKLARVSNPANEDNVETAPRLIGYLIRNSHWSPFEMVSACVEIETTRDISRQILRHRSFSFQEFSGRYAAYDHLETEREVRMQDPKNRQSSLECSDEDLQHWWTESVENVGELAGHLYHEALARGVAKEVARVLLPEGLVPTRMYMAGTLRSWIHYWEVRCDESTQKEHRAIADATRSIILSNLPSIRDALENATKD